MKIRSLLATALMVVGLSTSAFAQEDELVVIPFISGWFNGFYESSTETTTGALDVDSSNFTYNLSEFSTAGFMLEYGNLSGEITLKASKDNYLKRAYVSYDMGNEQSLLFGITETLAWYNFGQVSYDYNALINYGALSDNTRPMIMWSGYGLNVALIAGKGIAANGEDAGLVIAPALSGTFTDTYQPTLPRLDVSYGIETGFFGGSVFASYAPHYYSYKSGQLVDDSMLVNSFSVGFGGQFVFGDLFADATAYYGMNLGMVGSLSSSAAMPVITNTTNANGDITGIDAENASSYGAAIGVGYAMNDTFTPSVGFGYAASSAGNVDTSSYALYLNVGIAVYDWLYITPEVAYTNDETKTTTGVTNSTTSVGTIHVGLIAEFAF